MPRLVEQPTKYGLYFVSQTKKHRKNFNQSHQAVKLVISLQKVDGSGRIRAG